MCLGIPMKVTHIDGDEGLVESGGLRRKVSLSLLRGLKVGDYIIVHAGFGIEKLNEKMAKETLDMLKGMHEIH